MNRTRPLAALALLAASCGDGVIGTMYPDGPVPAELAVDVLLVVDESRAADDALEPFAAQAAALVRALVAPACVLSGERLAPAPPEGCSPNDRPSVANVSLRVGVVSSALEGGESSCDARGGLVRPAGDPDAAAVLVARSGAPIEELEPFERAVRERVLAAREARRDRESRGSACEHAQPLEVARRFLAEPQPSRPSGAVDVMLLADRQALLRPRSTVLTLAFAPRNDCSTGLDVGSVLHGVGSLPRARSVCALTPDDACCAPCGAAVPEGCGVDAACDKQPLHTQESDPPALRCWEPRRRFGLDALESPSRYVQAFSSAVLEDGSPNALFVGGRGTDDVLFLAVTGVPWQDLGSSGLSVDQGTLGPAPWANLLGLAGAPPGDVHMLESRAPRPGLLPPGSFPGDAKSGAEHAFPDQLQYACRFPLLQARDCGPAAAGEAPGVQETCFCGVGAPSSPLCDLERPSFQVSGAATPGTRLLAVARALDWSAGVGSACSLGAEHDLVRPVASWVFGTLAR